VLRKTKKSPETKPLKPSNSLENEFRAFEWDEIERDAERAWYDDEEQYVYNDKENVFLGDEEKFR
jgi:hypothetical protein